MPEHSDTLIIKKNLAPIYETVGDFRNAIRLYEGLGVDHELTPDRAALTLMTYLAFDYTQVNEFPKAVLLYEKILQKRRGDLGDDDPDTVKTIRNLALAYRGNNEFKHALPLFEEYRAIQAKRLSKDDPKLAELEHELQEVRALATQAAEPGDNATRGLK